LPPLLLLLLLLLVVPYGLCVFCLYFHTFVIVIYYTTVQPASKTKAAKKSKRSKQAKKMGNSASALPYSIGKQVQGVGSSHQGWTLHEGQRKSDGQSVTVFVAKKPALNKTAAGPGGSQLTLLQPALHHFSYCKKLRHPHILSVHATLDTDNPTESSGGAPHAANAGAGAGTATANTGDLIIVTESCIPLDVWLQSQPPLEQVAWGLESVIRALHFLHTSANIAHGSICPESLYVTRSGDVKLWNFALATNVVTASGGLSRHFIDYDGLLTPQPFRSPERQQGQYSDMAANGTHCMDAYSVGILVSHLYHNQIPSPLVKAVQRLCTTNLRMRPRLQPLLKCPVFDTPHQKLQLQLEEFAVQPVESKISFWQNLLPMLRAQLISPATAVYKLLPLMKQSIATICSSDAIRSQDMYRREGNVIVLVLPLFFFSFFLSECLVFVLPLSCFDMMFMIKNSLGNYTTHDVHCGTTLGKRYYARCDCQGNWSDGGHFVWR
jgi:SCY1-like protein 1